MGIVIRQSIRNTVITYIGFGIGAINALILYPHFLGKELYGLTGFVLSAANVIMPIMAFGVHNTLVKYFVQYKTEEEKNGFLTYVVLLPLLLIIPLFLVVSIFYDPIALYFSSKNPGVYTYFWQIPIIGFCMGYFEIFYAWAKVHLESVFGNFVRELLLRVLISIGLTGVFLKWYDAAFFINLTLLVYLIATVAMMVYAFRVRPFRMDVTFPVNHKEVFTYSIFIILSGSIANVLLDLDKTILVKFVDAEYIAFYGVAIFIATVISVPARAMQQITYPITAKLMAEGKHDELNDLYKKSSITLQVLGGLIFAGIVVNIRQLYLMMPPEYSAGLFSVFVVGLSKYIDLILGNNNAIIFNSHYYRAVLILGILLTLIMVGLNLWLIPIMGIDGAAIATLISIGLYLLAKLLFVVLKMDLYPFTVRTLYSTGILIVTILGFYFWEFPFHPILNIGLKSVLVTFFFMGAHYFLNVSSEVNGMLHLALSLFKRRKS
ncbi:lipopolysaccharide biosynthesis protein [Flavobacterium silvaticum]|uniref:Oligosaccharide flippase family protein n=1 Tax=Flavobacterium silvaticum TaxID=1852020 RepID=A0A972JI01_9FLAO|nr:polysaccharide biosynthesis C-terminal domain-containing protein [Flavobacterium silvaticum]NMH26787.1 oligosaccharide flippase family protein [Flavobacterium silvaticum]